MRLLMKNHKKKKKILLIDKKKIIFVIGSLEGLSFNYSLDLNDHTKNV